MAFEKIIFPSVNAQFCLNTSSRYSPDVLWQNNWFKRTQQHMKKGAGQVIIEVAIVKVKRC